MAEMTFNTKAGAAVERHLLIAYLNTGTGEAPVWSPLGKRVEDSSQEFDWSSETKNDVLGNTYTNAKKPIITQTFDPCELDSGDAAQIKLWNLAIKDQDVAGLTTLDMLIVHTYAGASGSAFAERYSACSILPSALGGEAFVGMPIDITYGGTRTVGTAAVTSKGVTFTPASA